jgi:Phosphotransferase enzyme family
VPSLARQAAPLAAVARLLHEHGLPTGRLETWKDGSNLLVRPVPAPVIVRIATFTGRVRGDPTPYLAREVALVSWLHARGAPVMGPPDVMPPGPFLLDGWGMAAFRFEDHRGAVPSPRDTLGALDDLHAAMAGYPGALPVLGPATGDLDLALAFAERSGILPADRTAGLRAERDRLVAALLTHDPDLRPQHGDAFPRNTVVSERGIVWIDFEDACLGSRLWDLGTLALWTGDDGVRAEAEHRHGADAVATAMALRRVQGTVWNALHRARVDRGW